MARGGESALLRQHNSVAKNVPLVNAGRDWYSVAMDPISIVVAIILLAALGLMYQKLSSTTRVLGELKNEQGKDQTALLIKEDLKAIHERMDRQSDSVQKSIQNQLGESAKIVRDVTEKLTKLDETNRQVIGFTDQLKKLQDVLQNPKRRGILGEYYLESLLKNVFPPNQYEMQVAMGEDESTGKQLIADAVIFIQDKKIAIDAKFSLENYNRFAEAASDDERKRFEKVFVNDLKARIVETAKYIQPQRGTLDFAFMFIPHEAIYYDLLTNRIGSETEENQNLLQRAATKYKVIIVSPTSFLAYLQTVMQGLRAMKIEETAQDIMKRVADLGRHITKYDEVNKKLGATLGTAVNQYNLGQKELERIDKDVVKIADVGGEVEALQIEKPHIE